MTMQTKDLVKGLNIVSSVIRRFNTIPILSSALVSSVGNDVTLTGTDMDIQIDVTFPGKVRFDKTTLGNPGSLGKVLSRAGGDETRIGYTGGEPQAMIYSGDLDMDVTALPHEDFPDKLSYLNEDWSAEVGTDFLGAVKQVAGAMSGEETRYYLNGIFFEPDQDWGYNLVATDGHRLYSKPIQIANDNKLGSSAIIPKKMINLLLKMFDGKLGDAPLRVTFGRLMKRNDQNTLEPSSGSINVCRITATLGDHKITLTSKLIDGNFPDYRRVMPKDDQMKLGWSYSVADLRRVLSTFTAYRSKNSTGIKLAMAGGQTTVTATWVEFGRMRMKLPHDGEVNFEIGFNSRYVFEIVERLANCDRIMFQGSDSVGPFIVTGDKDPDFKTLLMPMRV